MDPFFLFVPARDEEEKQKSDERLHLPLFFCYLEMIFNGSTTGCCLLSPQLYEGWAIFSFSFSLMVKDSKIEGAKNGGFKLECEMSLGKRSLLNS